MTAPTAADDARVGFSLDARALRSDFWAEIFPRAHPVWVEIGPGRGEFLLTAARQYRERNFLAIERSQSRARAIEHRIGQKELQNARIVAADASCVVSLLPDACVAGYFVQFPDPWWKRRHERRRLWTADFVAAVRRTLAAGASVELVSDVEEYFALAQEQLAGEPGLECLASGRSDYASTSFARKALARGDAIYRSVHRRR